MKIFQKVETSRHYSNLKKRIIQQKQKNYKPVSVLPSVSKAFERLKENQIASYVYQFLSPYLCVEAAIQRCL